MPAQVPADARMQKAHLHCCTAETDVWQGDNSEEGDLRQFPFSTCGSSAWRETLETLWESLNLVGMIHCVQSARSDFDRFLRKSACCLAEGAVVIFSIAFFISACWLSCVTSSCSTLRICSRTFVLVPTIREYTRGICVFWHVYRTAYRSSHRRSADYFFCESAKFFAQNVRGECRFNLNQTICFPAGRAMCPEYGNRNLWTQTQWNDSVLVVSWPSVGHLRCVGRFWPRTLTCDWAMSSCSYLPCFTLNRLFRMMRTTTGMNLLWFFCVADFATLDFNCIAVQLLCVAVFH